MRKPKRPDTILSEDAVALFREQIAQGLGMMLSGGVSSEKTLRGASLILDACQWLGIDAKERFNSGSTEILAQSGSSKSVPPSQEDSSHTSGQA